MREKLPPKLIPYFFHSLYFPSVPSPEVFKLLQYSLNLYSSNKKDPHVAYFKTLKH